MATDPYHAVQREVQTSLQAAETLHASYLRIRSTARNESEELIWARNELKATLAALDADIEDLDESVKIVEETGARMFGLEEGEVAKRRQYVSRVRRTVQDIRDELGSGSSASGPAPGRPASRPGGAEHTSTADDNDEQAQWSREEQQMIMQQQDHTMDTISGTLHTIAEQASLIGREVLEHNELLTDLESGVDNTTSKLGDAMKKLQKFIRENEETKSGWCIVILIVILTALLLVAVLV